MGRAAAGGRALGQKFSIMTKYYLWSTPQDIQNGWESTPFLSPGETAGAPRL
jgi:hypothetical protein